MSSVSTTLDNIVSHWSLDEASGTRVDSAGSNDLTDNNTVGQGTGIQGNCADFEASNSEYLSISDASATGLEPGSGDFSISMWVNMESDTGTDMTFASKFNSSGNNRSWRLVYQPQVSPDRILWQLHQTGSNSTRVLATWDQALATGTWYHIVATYNNSSNQAIVYLNASSLGTVTASLSSIYNGSAPFVIGADGVGVGEWDGLIDEVTYTSDVITPAEVTTLYNSGSGLPYSTGGGGEPTPTFTPITAMIT